MKSASSFHPARRAARRGVALVIVLTFVVLLTGLTLAFFSRSISERQISDSSASETKVSLLSEGAVSSIIGDLKSEIAAGSNPAPFANGANPTNVTIYMPKTAANMVPQRVGTSDDWANLVKTSSDTAPFFTGGPTRAAAAPSDTVSQNGRFISPARWNSHFLLPKKLASDTDATPVGANGTTFVTPRWVFVANDGTNPKTVNTNVVGRYAYAIYDEGGLLDVNAAGEPTTMPLNYYPYKASMAFADLRQLTSSGTPLLTKIQIDALAGRRSFVSSSIDPISGTQTPLGGSFPSVASPTGYTWNATNYKNYFLFNLGDSSGFLASTRLPQLTAVPNVYDRRVLTRQELINLLLRGLVTDTSASTAATTRATLQNALQYLTSYSRGFNQPSYAPVSRVAGMPRPTILSSVSGGNNVGDAYPSASDQDKLSPNFLTIRAQAAFTRADRTTVAVIGEPLVKRRFALQRLAWLTYKGASAKRTGVATGNPTDADTAALLANGVPIALLQQGTDENIQRYFGLTFDYSKNFWTYTGHNRPSNGAIGDAAKGAIHRLDEVAALGTREPDFFELLKASIDPGSQGKAAIKGPKSLPGDPDGALGVLNFQFLRDISLDAAIIQMGANIIDQFDTDGYPTRIVFDDDSGKQPREFRGVENLPYLYRIHPGVLKAREAIPTSYGVDVSIPYIHSDSTNTSKTTSLKDTGVGIVLAVPDLWNPHDQNSTLGSPRPGTNALSLRVIANSASPDYIGTGTPNNLTVGGFAQTANTAPDKLYGDYKGNSYDPPGNNSGGVIPPGSVTPAAPIFARDASLTTQMTGSNYGYTNPQVIDQNTSSILAFNAPDATLFREPTLLAVPNAAGSGLTMTITNPDITGLKDGSGTSVYTGGGLTCAPISSANPYPFSASGGVTPSGKLYTGIYLGVFPLRWVGSRWSTSDKTTTGWVYTSGHIGVQGNPVNGVTYSVQYQDESGNWVTYDEKYVNTSIFWVNAQGGLIQPGALNYTFVDPRTARFGSATGNNIADGNHYTAPNVVANWLVNTATLTGVVVTERPDYHSGFGGNFRGTYGNPNVENDWGAYTALGWHFKNIYNNTTGNGANSIFFQTGLFAQNNPYWSSDGIRYEGSGTVGAQDPTFYSDADGVVRRAMGAHMPLGTTSTVGQPLVTATRYPTGTPPTPLSQSTSRPKVLNRPFRSVAELGCVFSGNPWKNLDFSTPESGYAGLLDVFCINDTDDANGLMAGRLNLNTRQPMVLQAMLYNAYTIELNGMPNAAITATDAVELAAKLTARTSKQPVAGPNTANGPQPLANISELVGHWNSRQAITYTGYTPALDPNHKIDGKLSYDGFSADFDSLASTHTFRTTPVAAVRESAMRALTSVGNTRVWNLMIDVVAQTGRFPTNASSVNNFAVDGEQRCWVHLAIDRYTGEVIDRQLEIVKE